MNPDRWGVKNDLIYKYYFVPFNFVYLLKTLNYGHEQRKKKSFSEAPDWKQKSIKRGREVKALNKRIRELITSRDLWKTKYTETKKQCVIWETELNKIKKKLNEILIQ